MNKLCGKVLECTERFQIGGQSAVRLRFDENWERFLLLRARVDVAVVFFVKEVIVGKKCVEIFHVKFYELPNPIGLYGADSDGEVLS